MMPPELVERELEAAVLIEDPSKRRTCPVCRYNLHLYHINEKHLFLMCENDYCEFPFGYEPLQIVHDESQLVDNPPPCTKEFYEYPVGGINGIPPTPLGSVCGSLLTDLSKTASITDSERDSLGDLTDSNLLVKTEVLSERLCKVGLRRKIEKETNEEISKHLQHITHMNKELNDIDKRAKNVKDKPIKNEKWLANLKTLEGESGMRLLKPEETSILKKKEPVFALGELKISVNPRSSMQSVNIEILEKPQLKTDKM